MYVITNAFPYEYWDGLTVKEHLMIIPQRHVKRIGDLDSQELREYMDLLIDYNKQGYTTYTRTPENTVLSQEHLHTHLMTFDRKFRGRFILLAGALGIRFIR